MTNIERNATNVENIIISFREIELDKGKHRKKQNSQFIPINICSCHDVGDLETALDTVQQTKYNSYKSNTINIINSIEEYIKGN